MPNAARGGRPLLVPVAMLALAGALLAGCATAPAPPPAPTPAPPAAAPPPSEAPAAKPPPPRPAPPAAGKTLRGKISLYGAAHAGKPTASGEAFDPNALTMAHRTLPFGTRVRVTNLENQRSVEVVVNDRGPFVPGRIADVSAAAARQLGMVTDGVVEASLEVLP